MITRKLLAAAVSVAPLILAASAAQAQVSITTGTTTPVATATANNGAPADVDVAAGGSIGLTAAGTPAITLNSNNLVTIEGELGATNLNGVTGASIIGGYTGSFTDSGTILLTESYTAATDFNTGVLEGVFAQGSDRTGILVSGSSPFNGGITVTGGITVNGNNSYGLDIESPITGALSFQTVSPTSFTIATTVAVTTGSINMLGNNDIGLYVAPAGGVGGGINLTGVNATGTGSQAVVIDGNVGGTINVSGTVSATGYRAQSRSTTPQIESAYTAAELTQGGVAMTVGGNVGGGLIISAPPAILSTTNADLDSNGVPDAQQGSGEIVSYGSAAALQIGVAGQNAYLGVVGPGNGVTDANGAVLTGSSLNYGLVIQGTILGASLFDQVTTPAITGPLSAEALQIGTGSAANTAVIAGGIYNTGIVSAQAYQASATAIHFAAGGQTPLLLNDGQIQSSSIQQSTSATGFNPVSVYGVLIDPGAVLSAVTNNGGLTAIITGSQGAGAAEVGAIVDRSGTLDTVVNTGTISAQPNQTVLAQPMPIGNDVAIDISQSTAAQSITQELNPNLPASTAYVQANTYTAGQVVSYEGNVYQAITVIGAAQDPIDYPSDWKIVGSLSPNIYGDILFGNGGSTLNVSAGTVFAPVIDLGTGANSITIAGAAGSGVNGAVVTGAVEEGGSTGTGNSTLTINVNNGTLSDTNPNTLTAKSVSVGSDGLLLVAADPVNGVNTKFITSGASVFAPGAGLGLTLLSVPQLGTTTYVVLQTTGAGTLSAGSFASEDVANAPFLFTATPGYVPIGTSGGGELTLTVAQKTAAQLGFDKAEGEALSAVLADAPVNAGIEAALLTPTTESGLKAAYDQLLPNQGQGLFDALDAAAESISQMTSVNPDNGQRVAGTSLWLQEVNENVKREDGDVPASYAKLVGLVAGAEHLGVGGGAIGVTLSFMNGTELPQAQQAGTGLAAQIIEASLYYRRAIGGLTFSARGGLGGVFFNDQRTFVNDSTNLLAKASWDALMYDGHVGLSYEKRFFGSYYARPELSLDYLGLDEGGYSETGGGQGFDLTVASRDSSRMTATGKITLGREWGKDAWLRSELSVGYIDVVEGGLGDTIADFAGGSPFSLSPDDTSGGWAVVGFAIKAGSPSSYFALEGNLEYRGNEQIYDLMLAGRSIF